MPNEVKPEHDKVIFIELRYASGKVQRAEGDDAAQIWNWIQSVESLAYVHGARYEGPQLKETP